MNRPTIDVDDLVEMADEAIAEGDFTHAVSILRKAAAIAPLRKDIRNRMAIALEGTPLPRKVTRGRGAITLENQVSETAYDSRLADENLFEAPDEGRGREAISLIAKKAFDAAAGQTARAGLATRNLTNLLHHGIQTWKSSLVDQVKVPEPTAYSASKVEDPVQRVSSTTQAEVFGPEADLAEYLNRADSEESRSRIAANDSEYEAMQDSLEDVSQAAPPAPVLKKTSKANPGKKTAGRQTDVEDVLAAGIDGFIEAIGRANKKKISFGIVYFVLGSLFAFACFDVSRKFPAVETIPGTQVQTASLGNLNLSETTANNEAITTAKTLTAEGRVSEAVNLLKAQLDSGSLLKNRDQIRVELATVLNLQAEEHLTNNRLSDSVAVYREALKILPTDAALQLRLANALYYVGTLGDTGKNTKKAALVDAETILKDLALKPGENLQAHRLLGLVHEAQGQESQAKASWQKVLALAPSNSAESKEAASHLK